MRVLALFLVCFWGVASAADIGINRHDGMDDVIFSGEIRHGDAQLLKPFIDSSVGSGRLRRFTIHGPGGNVAEAMKIGEMLRGNNFSVFEPKGVSCISACIFAIMGGTHRVINGRIGLHRPLFLNIPNNIPRVQKLLLEGKQAMIEYSIRMGVSPKIIDDMYTLPNEVDIKFLSQNEISQYRLSTGGDQ